jgi:hypothetical protein
MLIRKLFLFAVAAIIACTSCSKDKIDPTPPPPPDDGGFNVKVTTIAGQVSNKGDEDGNGSNARFWNPAKMVYDSRNNMLYIADGTVIRSMDAQNNVETYVPLNAIGNSWNEILDMDVAPGAGGTLYVTTKNNELWKIEPDGSNSKVILLASNEYGGDDVGPLNSGDHFDLATGVATGRNGEIYFFNQSWNTLRRITDDNVEPFAGKPNPDRGGDSPYPYADGQGDAATFGGRINDIAADANGNIYVGDWSDELVRKVTPDGKVTSLFQYMNKIAINDDGPVGSAHSNDVTSLACNADGSLIFFSSYGNHAFSSSALRVVRPGIDVTTLVTGETNYGDGDGKTAGFGEIGGIAVTPDGKTIYVAEPGMKVIRRVDVSIK